MKEMKRTKRKWTGSIIAILLCIALLIGLTFAWFTDQDSATLNSIKAGNLDIELTHAVTSNGSTTYEDVDEDTVLFTANNDGETQILWEPGVVAYEVFQASNVGNLALQYKSILSVAGYNTVTDDDGTARSLADVLQVAVYEGTYSESVDIDDLTFYDFDEIASASASGVLLSEYEASDSSNSTSYSDCDTFSLILYWEPSGLDDYYNLNNTNQNSDGSAFSDGQEYLWISMGITLSATQYDYEYDSFTDQYDADATYAPTAIVTQLPASDVNVFTNTSGNYSAYEADVLYLFSALDDEDTAKAGEYADWNVDFEVSFSNAVTNAPLIGYYSYYVNTVLGVDGTVYFPISITASANETTRLLKETLTTYLGSSYSGSMTYAELCKHVGDFYCGVSSEWADENSSASVPTGTVMTVSLVLYESDGSSGTSGETGESVTIATYTYTFEE